MGRAEKNIEPENEPGAPEWMVTFSDCMTLLLTFFVLLLSFSSFDNRVFRRLKVIYSHGLTSIVPSRLSDRDALMYIPPVRHVSDLDKGSEKPTLELKNEDGLLKTTPPFDFNRGIVFMLPSNRLFWGNGVAISTQGRNTIDAMAKFLSEVPHRIVISEHGATNGQISDPLGLQRSWAVMNYLTTKENLDKRRFSISSVSTISQENNQRPASLSGKENVGRTVEIVLLERNIYN